MDFAFDAFVTAALFDAAGQAAFALGDGAVRFQGGACVQAHDGAILSACPHPSGQGLITGGDDGRALWVKPDGAEEILHVPGRWIDAAAASAASGLIALAAGREVLVRDAADPEFQRSFSTERSVADLAFDPKGRRLAAATYGGAALWYARIADQKPVMLKWAGSHIAIAWSPDGKFLMSSMQENQLHGWRVADEKNMRMGGYPAKVRSLAFLAKGQMMVTSGASGAIVWPFGGATGPMGKAAAEVGFEEGALVARVAATPQAGRIAAGMEDGRVWTTEVSASAITWLRNDRGAPVTALAISPDGRRVAWGCEDGAAGIVEVP